MWALPWQCRRKQAARFCECVTRKSNWIVLLLWIGAAALAQADPSPNVLAEILWKNWWGQSACGVFTKKVRREGTQQQQQTWSLYVLEGYTKNTLLGDFLRPLTYSNQGGLEQLCRSCSFSLPFHRAWCQCAELSTSLSWFLDKGIECTKMSSSEAYLWWESFKHTKVLIQRSLQWRPVINSSLPIYPHCRPWVMADFSTSLVWNKCVQQTVSFRVSFWTIDSHSSPILQKNPLSANCVHWRWLQLLFLCA